MMSDLKNLQKSKQAKRMNLADWRASRLHELPLPSGLTVTVRDCDLTDLMLAGKLPDAFMDFVEDAATGEKKEVDLAKIGMEMIKTNGPEYMRFLNIIVSAALVNPLIGDIPDETHITLDELSASDKTEIMQWVNREVPAVKPFSDGQGESIPPIQHGNGIRSKTEPILDPRD